MLAQAAPNTQCRTAHRGEGDKLWSMRGFIKYHFKHLTQPQLRQLFIIAGLRNEAGEPTEKAFSLELPVGFMTESKYGGGEEFAFYRWKRDQTLQAIEQSAPAQAFLANHSGLLR